MTQKREHEPFRPDCYCIRVRNASAALSRLYDRALEPYGLTIRQYSLLANLRKIQPASSAELADHVELDRSSLSRLMRPLRERGLVRDTSKRGTRAGSLELSEEGEALIGRATPAWQQAQERVERKVGARRLREFERVLDELQELDS